MTREWVWKDGQLACPQAGANLLFFDNSLTFRFLNALQPPPFAVQFSCNAPATSSLLLHRALQVLPCSLPSRCVPCSIFNDLDQDRPRQTKSFILRRCQHVPTWFISFSNVCSAEVVLHESSTRRMPTKPFYLILFVRIVCSSWSLPLLLSLLFTCSLSEVRIEEIMMDPLNGVAITCLFIQIVLAWASVQEPASLSKCLLQHQDVYTCRWFCRFHKGSQACWFNLNWIHYLNACAMRSKNIRNEQRWSYRSYRITLLCPTCVPFSHTIVKNWPEWADTYWYVMSLSHWYPFHVALRSKVYVVVPAKRRASVQQSAEEFQQKTGGALEADRCRQTGFRYFRSSSSGICVSGFLLQLGR